MPKRKKYNTTGPDVESTESFESVEIPDSTGDILKHLVKTSGPPLQEDEAGSVSPEEFEYEKERMRRIENIVWLGFVIVLVMLAGIVFSYMEFIIQNDKPDEYILESLEKQKDLEKNIQFLEEKIEDLEKEQNNSEQTEDLAEEINNN